MSASALLLRRTRAVLLAAACAGAVATEAFAASPVVRPAPDFSFPGVGARKGLRSLRGQPVVLVIARSPETKEFRKQAKMIASIYQEFASRGTVFVAAFSEKEGKIESNIPFVVANNGPGVAAAYGLTDDFRIAVIGPDGNLDQSTDKPLSGFRLREVIQNSYTVQQSARKEKPKGPPQ